MASIKMLDSCLLQIIEVGLVNVSSVFFANCLRLAILLVYWDISALSLLVQPSVIGISRQGKMLRGNEKYTYKSRIKMVTS